MAADPTPPDGPLTREAFERLIAEAIASVHEALDRANQQVADAVDLGKRAKALNNPAIGRVARAQLSQAQQTMRERVEPVLDRIGPLLEEARTRALAGAPVEAVLQQLAADQETLRNRLADLQQLAAAIPVLKLPAGFEAESLVSFLARYLKEHPTIGIELAMRADPRSTADEVGPGVERIQALEQQGLIQFATNPQGEPALFLAARADFPSDDLAEAAHRMVQWFDRSGDFDAPEGKILSESGPKSLPARTLDDWLAFYPMAVASIGASAQLSRRVVEEVLRRWVAEGHLKFVEGPNKKGGVDIYGILPRGVPRLETRSEREIMKGFRASFDISNLPTGQPPQISVSQWLLESSRDAAAIADVAQMEIEVFAPILYRFEERGWITIERIIEFSGRPADRVAVHAPTDAMTAEEHRVCRALEAWGVAQENPIPPASKTAQYIRAVETQYQALADLKEATSVLQQKGEHDVVTQLWELDIAGLQRAETYCWFPDPLDAALAAAASLPKDVRALRDLTEAAAGWWYFTVPLALQTTSQTKSIMGLLWQWVTREDGSYGLLLSAYTWVDLPKKGRSPVPTTLFFWRENESLGQALLRFREEYREQYRHGRAYPLQGEEQTLTNCEVLATFWWAGARWLQQKILVYSKGHIERHARKRMERDLFKRPLSDIQIIQLRRKETIERPEGDPAAAGRHLSVRFTVSGHWRNQYYPSKAIYQPKWIDPFVKGPDWAPMKRPSHKVYVVNR